MSSEGLSESQIVDFQDAFLEFDADCDGVIDADQLAAVLRKLGQNPTEAELQDLMFEVDKDGNGTIDFPEFLGLMAKKTRELCAEEEIREAFKFFDGDGNGYIDRDELAVMLQFLGEPLTADEIEAFIEEADVDRDGVIDYAEFFTIMGNN